MRTILFFAAAAALAACTPSPERAATVNVQHDIYRTMSCDAIGMRRALNKEMLTRYITAQKRNRTADIVGLIMINAPIGFYVANDWTYEIGRLWGEQYALRVVGHEKGCEIT